MIPGRILRLLGLAGVWLFLISAFTPMPNLLIRWIAVAPQLVPAEAIVVLGGGGIQSEGMLTTRSMRLALHGIALYRKGLAPLLVFSGPGLDGGPTEAEVRADLAREMGIPPDAILADPKARTTREEAGRLEVLLRPRGVQRILLVTNSQHMVRAQPLLKRAGFDVLAAPVDEIDFHSYEPEDRLRLMRQTLRELLARFYYQVAGYL
jgi:uncharacterized SAM-binding protein YcdF (DUF218 family)